jgi:hypothetical protein
MKYSLKKGVGKGILGTLAFIAAFVIPMFPDFFNKSIVDILVMLFPIIKTASIGGLLLMLINYLKIKYASKDN